MYSPIDEVRSILYFAQDELVVILVGTKACKGCDDLADRKVADMVAGLGDQISDACCCCVVSFLVLNIHSGGAYDQVAVNCRGNKDALAELCRLREDGVGHVISYSLVKQAIVTASGCDMDLLLRDHIVEIVCIDACCVDDVAGLVLAVVGPDLPDRLAALLACVGCELLNLCVEEERKGWARSQDILLCSGSSVPLRRLRFLGCRGP